MGTAAMAAAGMMGGPAMGAGREKEGFIWATLLHMGRNMWSDVPVPFWGPKANRVTDPKKLTRQQRKELRRRASRGETVTLE